MTKANRRRKNKGGRPRIEGAEREPNGRITRPTRVETEKEARAVVIEARQRIFGASESDCAKEEFGSVLGRLFLAKAIKKHQYEAGKMMSADFDRYYMLTGIPHPSAKAQDISRVRGLGRDSDPLKARSAANRVMMIEQQLGSVDVQGRPVTSVCKRVCVMDDAQGMELAHMIKYLVAGLEQLSTYYGVERQVAA
jgi:hypothetical protein